MSLEDIKKITDAEKRAADIRAAAVNEGKLLISDAERMGREYEVKARAEAEAEVKKLLEKAEAEAARRRELKIADAQRRCDALKAAGNSRLDEAAAKIVERIVNA